MTVPKSMPTAETQARRAAACKLRQLRHEKGLSQEQAALRYGVSVRQLRALESGRVRMTGLELYVKMKEAA